MSSIDVIMAGANVRSKELIYYPSLFWLKISLTDGAALSQTAFEQMNRIKEKN